MGVGCVVMLNGIVASATSTGGMYNKMIGRIGDSPIIGAGTYAHNETGAFSGTGKGELYITYSSCMDVHNRMYYNNKNIQNAIENHIDECFDKGTGGMIGVDKYGNIGIYTNTLGMYRGYFTSDMNYGNVAIWEQEFKVKFE